MVRKLLVITGVLLATAILILKPQKLFADTPPTTSISIDASATMGSNSWYTSAIPVTLTATQGTNPINRIEYYIDSGAIATSSANPARLTLIQQGTHTLHYYAVDQNGLAETTRNFDYKLDIVAPTNWNTFTLTNSGNAHTFTITVKVADKTSGLDNLTAEFQYSVDNGDTWGYYSNLTQCSSTWNDNQWRSASTSPNTPGTNTATITIPSTDYCNSNWADTKYIRIRIKDMAGLLSTKQYALMSPWIQTTGGDVYSKGNIDMLTEGSPGSEFMVMTESGVVNSFSSAPGWTLKNYSLTADPFYTTYWAKLGSAAQTMGSTIPTTAGVYKVNSSLTVSSTTLPAGFSNQQNLGPVIFVNGDLYIDTNISMQSNSTILWIVSGDVGIKSSVTRVDGLFLVDGEFMSSYNGSGSTQLVMNGLVATSLQTPNLSRSLGGTSNTNTPAEVFNYTPQLFLNNNLISNIKATPTITWKELITR